MILIPGLLSSGDVWSGTVAHFKDRYECHVLTLAGFAGQPAVPPPFLQTVRDDVLRYIQEKKLDHPVIVGHSLGGFLAFWIAATAPDAVGPLVAVDGVPFLPALMDPSATLATAATAAGLVFSSSALSAVLVFLLFYGTLLGLMFGWIPRVTARRLAAELAEDPGARKRHQRERRWQIFAAILGFLTGGGALLWAILQ